MKIKNKIIRNIKPKDYDINYEYICPKCGVNHWLTSRESKTKNFKIACDCGRILSPARIKKIIIIYEDSICNKDKVKKTAKDIVSETEQVSETVTQSYVTEPISQDVL
ncbi:MAG: hypothetical protein VKK05_09255, partial [Synechococcus sp.]|nr:hypothetical protein [Synechococcus sp.]